MVRYRSTDQVKLKGYGESYSISDRVSSQQYVDAYRQQRAPNAFNLVAEYEATAYACANQNAIGVASTPLRLFVKSSQGQVNRFWPTKKLGIFEKNRINKKLRLSTSQKVEEITDHPFLKLLAKPNEHLNQHTLIEITQLFQDIVGTAYWRIVKNSLGRLDKVYYLNSQFVQLIRDKQTAEPIYYLYCGVRYELDEIIRFHAPNPNDEYTGISPLRACWESVNIVNKLDATQASMLDNEAIPQLLVSPAGEDSYMGADTQQRYEQRWRQKFSRGQGGVVFTDEPVTIQKLSFSPRDLSALQIKEVSKIEQAAAFGVPLGLIETKDVNEETLLAARMLHASSAISDRCDRIAAVINHFLIPLYDDTGRLFVEFDDPSPENKKAKQEELTGYVTANIITRNEARNELGIEAHEDGDGLFPIQPGMQGLTGDKVNQGEAPESDSDEQPAAPEAGKPDTSNTTDVQATALNGAQVTALTATISQVSQGLLPIESARAVIAAAFPAFTAEQIDNMLKGLVNFKPREPEPTQPGQGPEAPGPTPTKPAKAPPVVPAADQPGKAKAFNMVSKAAEFGVPEGDELKKVIAEFFQKKRLQIVGSIQKGYVKKSLPSAFIGLDKWTEELGTACKPLIELYLDKSARELLSRVGASPDVFDVTNPHIIEAVNKAVLAFSQSTIDTTSKALNDALAATKQGLAEGLISTDNRLADLTKAVNEVFERLSDDRAFQIAQTEASRAHHLGWQIAAEESGVVVGKRWLLSADPCPECIKYKDKQVGLRDNFGTRSDSSEAYQNVPYPPCHPRCRCGVLEILDIED